ncbi:MAG: hypothetical protein LBR20_05830 [Propionibacteriaceae bacterium]|jgi:sirohydrochlorin ferrochelatase|nr:hypothetical protein [Propionibacteriaceae bacterium]
MNIIESFPSQDIEECVLVPLGFHNAVENDAEVEALLLKAKSLIPDVRFAASRPLGPESTLLQVVDARLRSALVHAHCLELDGLVLSAERTGDIRGNALLARRSRQWSAHHRLPCITAVGDDNGLSVAQAIMSLRSQGRRHIAVGSLFLAPTECYQAQRELAFRFGAIAVSEPIGPAREVLDLVFARYAFAAFDLLDFGFGTAAEAVERQLRVVGE